MTDRLSLTNVLTDANIDRQNAERIATVIVRAIRYWRATCYNGTATLPFCRSTSMAEIGEAQLNIREKLAHIDQMLADHDRKRPETRLAPWQLILIGMATGVGLLVAAAALIKLLV